MPTARYKFTDAGDTLTTLAGDRNTAAVSAAIESVRRPDGALCAADLGAYRKEKDGPLNALRFLLQDEALTVAVWSESGFGMMQRRSARKQVEQTCLEKGLDAAIDWAVTNGNSDRLDLNILLSMFKSSLSGDMGRAKWSIVERSIRKWK